MCQLLVSSVLGLIKDGKGKVLLFLAVSGLYPDLHK